METEEKVRARAQTLWSLKPHLTSFTDDPGPGGDPGAGGEGGDKDPGKGADDKPEVTPEQKEAIAKFEKQVEQRLLNKIASHGYDLTVTKEGVLEITKKGADKKPDPKPIPKKSGIEDPDYHSYKRDLKALLSQAADIEDPTEREFYIHFLQDKYRGSGFVGAAQKQIKAAIEEATGQIFNRFDAEDRRKWYSGDRAFLKEMEEDIDRLLKGEGSAKDIDKLRKAIAKQERERLAAERAGEDTRAKLATEGFMETGGRRGSSTAPSLSTIEKTQAIDKDIRKAVADGRIDEVNALTTKRKRLYAE